MAFFHSPQVVTSGLMLALDARNPQSYPGSGTTFYDLSGRNNHFSIANGTSFNSGGWFNFDGTDDYMNNTSFTTTGLTNAASCVVWMRPNASQNDGTYNGLFSYGPRSCAGTTFNGSSVNFYLNGNAAGNGSVGTNTFQSGTAAIGATDLYGRLYRGDIAAIYYYNRALSVDEMTQNYQALKTRFGI